MGRDISPFNRGGAIVSNDSQFWRLSGSVPLVASDGHHHYCKGPRQWLLPFVQEAVALYVPYLPEPRSADVGRGARADVFARHVAGFARTFQRVLQVLVRPHVRQQIGAAERDVPFITFDLRICGGGVPGKRVPKPGPRLPEPPRIVVLIKGVIDASGEPEQSYLVLRKTLGEISDSFVALAPTELTAVPVRWVGECHKPLVELKGGCALVRPEGIGLGAGYSHSIEVRRALAGSVGVREGKWAVHRQAALADPALALPLLWPESAPDGLVTCSALLARHSATVLSIRVQPSRLTTLESQAVRERLDHLVNGREPRGAAIDTLKVLQQQRDLFQCVVQVSSECESTAAMVGQAFISEHVLGGARRSVTSEARRLCSVRTVFHDERVVAEYNLRNIEMLPWGCAWQEALTAAMSCGNPTSAITLRSAAADCGGADDRSVNPALYSPTSEERHHLELPEVFLERDVEEDPRLSRIRSLLSIGELLSVWRLPAVPPGGHPGLQSRYPNPFEQLPEPTPPNGDAISLGNVQWRGLDTETEFRVPFIKRSFDVAGVSDRSIVVAGSPGSGKTNFCLWFLKQLWQRQASGECCVPPVPKTPYLVIDPTRGNEFRKLIDVDSDDVVLFTVGDPRTSPFCFNPFKVPRSVSVQSHISRLMACFRAAYEMWDPLPAIFEMALRRAYEAKRRDFWKAREESRIGKNGGRVRTWEASIDFSEDESEPFPQLLDVVHAMGKGEKEPGPPYEKYEGERTVMSEMKEMWGGGTENAHTIVASTYLRLKNLSDNYDSIIGGPAEGRACVDLRKLMERPAILEFGMIGDSQALALIMSFLVCSLAGTIEGRDSTDATNPKRHMLVLEEAHRLLAGDHGGGKQGSSAKAQAAEDINTMLAEVRKYGQGVMIIDQRPGSLVGGVIDNAYLVALHRLNEEKGFRQFVQQLNLNADQQRFVRSELKPGQMVVLDRRSGTPVLLRPQDLGTDSQKSLDEYIRGDVVKMGKRVERVLENGSARGARRPFQMQLIRKLEDCLDACGGAEFERLWNGYLLEVDNKCLQFDQGLQSDSKWDRRLKVTQWLVDNGQAPKKALEWIQSSSRQGP